MHVLVYSVIALALIPSILFYFIFWRIVGVNLKKIQTPFPFCVSLIIVIGLGCLASYILNKPILRKVEYYAQLDLQLQEDFSLPEVIAINGRRDECTDFCQKLLLSGNIQKVLVSSNGRDFYNPESVFKGYEIKNLDECEKYEDIIDCLTETSEKLSAAGLIFLHEKIYHNEDYQDFKNLKRQVVFVEYLELRENKNGEFKKIYRFSKISAQPFIYPLMFGGIFASAGGHFTSGFYHYSLQIPNSNDVKTNYPLDIENQIGMLFEEAFNTDS